MIFRRLIEYAAVVAVVDLLILNYVLPKSAPLLIERATAPGPSTTDYSALLRAADSAIHASLTLTSSESFGDLVSAFRRLGS